MREWIRKQREARGLSQAGVAKQMGVKPADFSRLECGYRDFKPGEAEALARVLGTTAEFMKQGPKAGVPIVAPAPKPVGLAAAAAAAVPVAPAANEPPKPVVYDLANDPANFREMPDPAVLERGALDDLSYQRRLAEVFAYATKILHTSRVPADTWRAWREFEKKIVERRRG